MNVEQLIIRTSYVEVMRKGEASRSRLCCPFSTPPEGSSVFCGPWCPHFGDYSVTGKSIWRRHTKRSIVIKLTCGNGTEIVCPDYTQFADFRYAESRKTKP